MKKLYMLLAGAFLWSTAGIAQSGVDCTDPIVVDFSTALPYSDLNQSNCGSDLFDETCLGLYDNGDDIIYRLDVNESKTISISVDPKTTTYGGMAVYDDCPDVGTCLVTVENSSSTNPMVAEATLDAGTYYLMISTWASPDCIPDFDLTITEVSCPSISGLSVTAGLTDATISWNGDGNSAWQILLDTAGFDPSGLTPIDLVDSVYNSTGLNATTAYDAYVRVDCGEGTFGEWMMVSFSTVSVGDNCEAPIVVDFSALPFEDLSQSNCGSDLFDETCLGSYDNGDDIVYRLDVDETTDIKIDLDPKGTTYAGMAVYDDCPDVGTCLVSVTNGFSSNPMVGEGTLDAGTYYLMISTFAAPQCIPDFDLTITEVTCPSITGLSVTAGLNDATISWNADGNSAWQILLDTAGFDPSGLTPIDLVDSTYTAAGLDVTTAYDAYVRVDCGEGNFGEWMMVSFSTVEEGDNCEAPIVVDFSAGLPYEDLNQSNCGSDLFDETCLGSYDNGDDIVYRLDVNETTNIKIDLDPKGTTYAGMAVYDDCPDVGTCLVTVTNGSSSDPMVGEGTLDAGTYYLMISTFAAPQCIPDFDLTITEVACPSISGLAATAGLDNATISWNGDGNSAWQILLDTAGFDPSGLTPIDLADSTYSATGLAATTAYDAYVRVDCGEGTFGEWMMVSFSTVEEGDNCEVPIVVDFSAGLPYEDLNQSNCGSDLFDETCLGSYDNGDDIVYRLDVNETTTIRITLDPKGTTYAGMAVYDDCPDVGNCLVTATNSSASTPFYAEDTLDAGTYYLMISTFAAPQCIPDFDLTIKEITCPSITGLTIGEITETEATVSWDNGGNTAWEVIVVEGGVDPSTETPVAVTDTFYVATGLTDGTDYDVYVRVDCGEGSFGEWELISFTTLFINTNALTCNEATVITPGDYFVTPLIGEGASQDNATGAAWFAFTPDEDGLIDVVSCLGGADTRLWIWDGTCDNLVEIASADDVCPFNPNGTGSSYAAAVYEVAVTGGTTYYIEWDDRWSDNPFNFQLAFYLPPPCPDLEGLSVSVASTEATLSWEGEGNSAWDVIVVEEGVDPTTETPVAVTDTFYVATGLMMETAYDAYVRVNCEAAGDSLGAWESIAFTTLGPPPANNLPCDAESITVDGDAVSVDNTNATLDGPTPDCWFNSLNGDVWLTFDFTPTAELNGVQITSTAGGNSDSQLALYTVDGCPDGPLTFTELGCSEDIGFPNFMSEINSGQLEAGTYYIQCSTYGAGTGDYTVSVSAVFVPDAPDNDECDGAPVATVTVGGGPVTVTGDGTGATAGDGFPAAEVWEAFTLDDCADVVISFCGSDPAASALYVNLFDACPLGASLPAATIVDTVCGDANLAAVFSQVPAGTYYYPVIADPAAAGGYAEYTMTINATPCPACLPVTNLAVTLDGSSATSTWDATDEGAYQLVWGLEGIDPDAETPIDLVTNSYDMTGLVAGLVYDCYVRNDCGDETSTWTFASFVAPNEIEGESFEGDEFPPVGWSSIDNDGDGNDWFQYGFVPYAGAFSAASASWSGGAVLFPDNFLVTPQRTVTDDNPILRWYHAAQDPDWPSDFYGVWVSTTGNAAEDFTDEVFSETIENEVWVERTVDLSAYIGQDIYLAFRHYNSSDWFYMKIDNVVLPGIAVGVDEAKKADFAIYPNPNNGVFTLTNADANGEYVIELIDLTGKVVHSELQILVSGQSTEITANDVQKGVYMVRLTNQENQTFRSIRMVIQ
jgi:hypothetical protein